MATRPAWSRSRSGGITPGGGGGGGPAGGWSPGSAARRASRALADGEAAGWVAVEPRENYPRLWARKQAWMRMDPELEGVWSVACFVVRKGQRRSGLTYELATATVEYGEQVGARVLEGYPIEPPPG